MYMCCSLTINPAGSCDVCGHVYVLFLQNPMGPCHVMYVCMYVCCSPTVDWAMPNDKCIICICAVLPPLDQAMPCSMHMYIHVVLLHSFNAIPCTVYVCIHAVLHHLIDPYCAMWACTHICFFSHLIELCHTMCIVCLYTVPLHSIEPCWAICACIYVFVQ